MESFKLTADALMAQDPELAILPVGSLEQHGPHLPLMTDWAIAMDLGRRVAEKMAEAMKEAAKMPKFRDPTEEEMDPASPEGEAYQKARKAFMEEQAKLLKEKLSKPNKTEEKPAVSEAERNSDDPAPQAVIAMNELWERAYSCQASAIRIRLEVQKLLAKGGEAELLKAETKENMKKLGSTGVQDTLNKVVFEELGMIIVYPVEDEGKYCNAKGVVLPDALLLPKGTTPRDLAFRIHTDIGNGFLYAVDAKSKMRIKDSAELKHGDVIKIVSTAK